MKSITPPVAAAGACGALLLLFAGLCYSAARTKSATYDEPFHVVAGYTHRFLGDYRIDSQNPALFGRYATALWREDSIRVDTESDHWREALTDQNGAWTAAVRSLYRTPGADGASLVGRARLMFVPVAVLLGATVAVWAWKLGGAAAAIVATFLFAFDPNFIAHGGIVKNDVAASLVFTLAGLCAWELGRRGSWPWLASLAMVCGVGVCVKFPTVMLAPLIALLFVGRAVQPTAWRLCGANLESRAERLAGAAACLVLIATVGYGLIWASYGFRFAPTSDGQLLPVGKIVGEIAVAQRGATPLGGAAGAGSPSSVPAFLLWANEHRLLPQGWIYGFLFMYRYSYVWPTYLMGETRQTGWWYYFPLAMSFKTPLTTLAVIGFAVLASVRTLLRIGPVRSHGICGWAWCCLALIPAAYLANAMSTNLNIGLRHVLPVYPFLFIFAGLAVSRCIASGGCVARALAVAAAVGLAVESASVYPDYLSFFNVAFGGSRGGIQLLSDSNLDWGQDLPALEAWQREHPQTKLYLLYFGTADPAAYGVRCAHLPGGWPLAEELGIVERSLREPGVIAVSATILQSTYLSPSQQADYGRLFTNPIAVLGGSIYLFDFPGPQPGR